MKVVRPYQQTLVPTQLWLTPKGLRLHDLDAAILAPPVRDKPAQRLIDIKQWAMQGAPYEQLLTFRQKGAEARKITLDSAVRVFLEQLYFGAPDEFNNAEELYLLLPAIRDQEQRRNYRRLLTRAVRGISDKVQLHFLFEPEMALEYFSLVRGELEFRSDENDLYLIVDCGALTCNVTAVLTTKDGVTTNTTGRSRGALNALPGTTANCAGRYVDRILLAEAREHLDLPEHEDDALFLIEATKIEAGLRHSPVYLTDPSGRRSWALTPARLQAMSEHLIAEYLSTFRDVLERTFQQLQGTAAHRDRLAEAGVADGAGLGRTIRGVVLAGGTSQLPGFRAALSRALDLSPETQWFVVGAEYPFVAAVGAMTHILDRRGLLRSPPRKRAPRPPLSASLQDDIYGIWRGNGEPKAFRLVERDAWPTAFFDQIKVPLPSECRGKKISLALAWGPDGHKKEEFLVAADANRWVEIDCSQTMPDLALVSESGGEELKLVTSGRKSKTRYYYLNTPPLLLASASSSRELDPPEFADHALFAEASRILVVDFGMSKTVLVSGEEAGPIRPSEFAEYSAALQRARTLAPGWSVHSGKSAPTSAPPGRATIDAPLSPEPSPQTVKEPAVEEPLAPPRPDEPLIETAANATLTVNEAPLPRHAPIDDLLLASPTASAREPSVPLLPCRGPSTEVDFLRDALELATQNSLHVAVEDLVFLHLALSVRPFILLAGAPGVGKTSLAKFHAALLGCSQLQRTLAFVQVQANWISDDPLFGHGGEIAGMLDRGHRHADLLQAVLLDEFNLTRPEYYMASLLAALDHDSPEQDGGMKRRVPRDSSTGHSRMVVYATLNIDEVARPPADKILDRAFVMSPVPPAFQDPIILTRPVELIPERRLSAVQWAQWSKLPMPMSLPADLAGLVRRIQEFERSHAINHYETLVPSRRALLDLAATIARFDQAGLEDLDVSRSTIVDRAVAGRILPRLRGEYRRLKPLLETLADFFLKVGWPVCERHVRAMLGRAEFGFVSFWT